MKFLYTTLTFSILLVNGFKWNADPVEQICPEEKMKRDVTEREPYYYPEGLYRRQNSVGAGAGIGNVSVGTGPVNAGIGNINITIGNVTVEAGNIDIENIHIGDVTVLVSVALSAGSGPTATQAAPAQTSSAAAAPAKVIDEPRSTITASPTIEDEGALRIRQVSSVPSVSASASVSAGNVGVDVGAIGASVGNVTLTVGNILVKLGSITIKNVTIGNILVAVQLGQPSLGNGTAGVLSGLLGAV